MKHNTYRRGKVHVCEKMCSTCIFRPGNKMELRQGRVEKVVEDAIKNESAVICHSTLSGNSNAVCRGFFDKYKTKPLQLAERLGVIEFVSPPPLRKKIPID